MQTQTCPLCNQTQPAHYLSCTDYLLSAETFELLQCRQCGLIFTYPRPGEDQIGKYYQSEDYISHTETKKGLINRLYHYVRRYNLRYKLNLLDKETLGTKKILDVGCGTGHFLQVCQQAGAQVQGVEVSPQARALAEQNLQQGLLGNSKELQPNEQFDIITLWHVLEHFHQVQDSLSQLLQHLKPQGLLVLALPNPQSYDAHYYQQHWAAYDVPRHLSHFTQASLHYLFKQLQLQLVATHPLYFDAYYISMLSEKNRQSPFPINYLNALYRGWQSNRLAKKQHTKTGTSGYSSQIYLIQKQA